MRLAGIERASAQLAAFEVAGRSSADTLLGMSRSTALVVGGLGLLGTALTVQGIRKFASFDEAMTQSLAIMGDVSQEMEDDMVKAARSMARQTVFSADQAAESYFFLASAGLDAKQSVEALPVVAKFAQAGMFDMARATELATDAQSALGLTSENTARNVKNLTRVTDVLVKANTLANATVEEFSESLTNRAAPRLRQMNKEIEEGVAALAVFADQGIKGRRAGTLLDMTLRELSRRARENTEAFEEAGVAVFTQAGEVRNLADIIADLEERMEGLSVKQRSAELAMLGFQQRSIRGILALMGMSEQIRQYEKDLKQAAGTTQEVADKQLDTLIKKLGILGSELADVALSIGEGPAATMSDLTDATINWIREMRSGLRSLDHEMGQVDENLLAFLNVFQLIEDLRITLDPRMLAWAEDMKEKWEDMDEVAGEWFDTLRQAPPEFQRLARGITLSEANLSRFEDILENLPPEALAFVDNFAQAERVMRRMVDNGESLQEALMNANVPLQGLPDALLRDNLPITELLPEDAEERAKFIEDLVSNAENLQSLAESRREAGKDISGVLSQLKAQYGDIQTILDSNLILNTEHEDSLQRQANSIREFLNTLKVDLKEGLDESISSYLDNTSTIVALTETQIEHNRLNLGLVEHLVDRREGLQALLESGVLTLQQQLAVERERARVLAALDASGPERGVAQRGIAGPGRIGRDEIDRVEDEMEEGRQRIQGMLRDTSAEMEEFGDKMAKDMARIGANAIVGLALGMRDKKEVALSILSQILNALIFNAMSTFSIFSPSRVMRDIGGNITLGLAEGLASERHKVARAWGGVLDTVTTPDMMTARAMGQMNALTPLSGLQTARMAGMGANPSVEVRVDTSGLPEPKTPFDVVRDHEWQKVLRTSIEVAREDGFK